MKYALIVIALVATYIIGVRGGRMHVLRDCQNLGQFYIYTLESEFIVNKFTCVPDTTK